MTPIPTSITLRNLAVRRLARDAVVALIEVNRETGVGDLWVGTEGMTAKERLVFDDEVGRCIKRVTP